MPAKTLQQIQEEADRMFGKQSSAEKFRWSQQQQAAAGLPVQKRKRGGLAGLYDRNKRFIQAAIPTLAGLFIPGAGGALAGAVAGGLARGLDREGKRGIGLDFKQAASGALTGAGLGSLGGMAGAKLGIGGAGGAASATSAATPGAVQPMSISSNMQWPSSLPSTGGPGGLPSSVVGSTPIGSQVSSAISAPMSGPAFSPIGAAGASTSQRIAQLGAQGAGVAGATNWRSTLTNPNVIAGGAGAIADVMGQNSQQRIAEQQMEQQGEQFQQQFNAAEEERRRQQEQANRLASLFMPTR